MNKVANFFGTIVLALSIFTLVSCDDEEPIPVDNIVGTWDVTSVSYVNGEALVEPGTVTFNDSGDGKSGTGTRSYQVTLLGNTLTIDDGGEPFTWSATDEVITVTSPSTTNGFSEQWQRASNTSSMQEATYLIGYNGQTLELTLTLEK